MTEEFRLVLCEPVVRAKVKAAKKAKLASMRKWQGPLMPHVCPEWDAWYHAQRGVIIKVEATPWRHVTPARTPARGRGRVSA